MSVRARVPFGPSLRLALSRLGSEAHQGRWHRSPSLPPVRVTGTPGALSSAARGALAGAAVVAAKLITAVEVVVAVLLAWVASLFLLAWSVATLH
ncbi:MAG: hypothetical protein H0V60_10925 [Actinobacteria bacterium]|nr:hypothetical protein [Actinomycetota bacterium]